MNILWGIALSAHLGLAGEYNSIHPYVETSRDNIVAGAYYNSENKISLFAGIDYKLGENTSMRAGVASGYSRLGLVPMFKLTHKNIFVMPAAEPNRVGLVLGYQFGF